MADARSVLARATAQLAAADISTARLDAEILLAACLQRSRSEVLVDLARLDISPAQENAFQKLMARRTARAPVAYLIGTREFWSLEFDVGPGVLIPRPDSECLIDTALKSFSKTAALDVLDLGTGPGTLLLSVCHEFPMARGTGIDISEIALGYAARNAEKFALTARTKFQRGDWLTGITARFDLILCNPPYIALADKPQLMADVADHEPPEALFAGEGGLAVYRHLMPQLAAVLKPQGLVLFEVGHDQAAVVAELASVQGFSCQSVPDLAGIARCLALRRIA